MPGKRRLEKVSILEEKVVDSKDNEIEVRLIGQPVVFFTAYDDHPRQFRFELLLNAPNGANAYFVGIGRDLILDAKYQRANPVFYCKIVS